jgi:dTDP-4-dehydrorhamnose reductase
MGLSCSGIVVLGATGQLGTELLKASSRRGIAVVPLGHDSVEITDRASVERALVSNRPRIVINTIASHDVDKCEEEPLTAMNVNAVGALYVARVAQRIGAKTVYISSDSVFGGSKPPPTDGLTSSTNAYVEDDTPAPLNVYGVTKLAGERLTISTQPNAVIVRLGVLYGVTGARGKGGGNFVETILKKAKERGTLSVVNDQWISPIYAWDAAEGILDILETSATGIFHVTNYGACTWFDLARKTLEIVNLPAEVKPIAGSSFKRRAFRPPNTAMHDQRLRNIRGGAMRTWQNALEAYLREKGYT